MGASIGSRAGISGLHWHWRTHSDPTLPVDQSLINFTDPGALGSPQGPQGLSAPRHVYRPLSAVLSPPPIPLLYRVEGLFQMRNHVDDHVQRNPGTFRLPRRTQRARRSSISALCTCMTPRGITHGTDESDDRGIDIEDGQLGGTIALEKASDDPDTLIFIMILTRRGSMCVYSEENEDLGNHFTCDAVSEIFLWVSSTLD